ncbi:DUF421 domain-containing protein [Bacillus piscicola]|uniref:DUF421 domain-containing protein n=1 Tax=Bacillus piscicola TaxID=1632684 RepID=UPI001F0961E1|nr:DUF421 domain-containing protein [Bacillus piscicola]
MDPLIDLMWKPLFIFITVYIFIRIGGKKALSEMNSFDILFIIVLGTIMSEPLVSPNPWQAVLYGGIFVLIYILFAFATLNNKLRWFLVASPTVLVRNGDIDEKGLRKERMTTNELISSLRQQGYTKVEDMELVMMEDTGKISAIPKAHARPLEPNDVQLHPTPTFIPIPIIMNGQIIEHNLQFLQKNEVWLNQQLKAHQLDIRHISDVTLATYNQDGTLSVDTDNPRDKSHTPNPNLYKPGMNN